MRPADTSPEAWKVFVDLQRKLTPDTKLQQVFEYSWFLVKMGEAVMKAEHPELTEREVFLRCAARRLNTETMRKVYGWDSATNTYVS
ncbi:MAG TPA: hypothetical protein VEX68_11250 [Bryobacteraceae bacterium]|nr:hypothetical protein [Bryobacteraceae bacterium]